MRIWNTIIYLIARFCAACQDKDSSTNTNRLRQLFHEAVKSLTATLTRVSRGRGFAAHLYALQEVVGEDEDSRDAVVVS